MVKKVTGNQGPKDGRKELSPKRLRMKRLHRDTTHDRAALQHLSPDKLPPASSSNAARQVRSRLNITFPVNWQQLHLKKTRNEDNDDE